VQCVAVWCSVLQYGAVWCSVVQCAAVGGSWFVDVGGAQCCFVGTYIYGVATIGRLPTNICLFCKRAL